MVIFFTHNQLGTSWPNYILSLTLAPKLSPPLSVSNKASHWLACLTHYSTKWAKKTKALPMNYCLAHCVNGGHSLVLVKAWLSMKSLTKAYGQPSISDCTNCCIWTRQITRRLVKRSKQSNNWIKVTVLDLSMPYCERCKKTLPNLPRKLRKTTVYQIGLPNSSNRIGVNTMPSLGKRFANLRPYSYASIANFVV